MATPEKKDAPAKTESKVEIPSTNALRGANEPPADAIAEDSGAAAVQRAVQETFDAASERGFFGQKADPTPRENYTLRGVTSGKPTPETIVRNADPLH